LASRDRGIIIFQIFLAEKDVRLIDEASGRCMRLKQRLDFTAQFLVAFAIFLNKRSPLTRRKFKRLLKYHLHLFPSLRCHDYSR